MRHYGSKRKAEVLMFACSLPSLLGSCSAGPTDATRCCWEHTRPTSNPNPSHAAVQSRAGTQGRAASSRAPARQRAPTAAGTARRGRSLRRGWPALLGKRRREPHLELLSAKPLPWAAPGCHGQEGKALSWRLPRAELPTTAACQGGRLSSARWAGVSSRSTLRGHKHWGSARREEQAATAQLNLGKTVVLTAVNRQNQVQEQRTCLSDMD